MSHYLQLSSPFLILHGGHSVQVTDVRMRVPIKDTIIAARRGE